MHVIRYLHAKVRNLVNKVVRPAPVTEAQHHHLKANPNCEACDSTTGGQAHHIRPYNKFPKDAAKPENFITLCEKAGRLCHIFFGHGDKFQAYNPNVVKDAADHKAAFLRGDAELCEAIKARAKAARLPDEP